MGLRDGMGGWMRRLSDIGVNCWGRGRRGRGASGNHLRVPRQQKASLLSKISLPSWVKELRSFVEARSIGVDEVFTY